MLENLKKLLNTPITIDRRGGGSTIRFHSYRISKSGKITNSYGETVNPIIRDGIAYLPLQLSSKKSDTVELEVGRIVYSYLIGEISLVSDEPKIIYKDGDGTNFRPENLDIESSTIEIEENNVEELEEGQENHSEKRRFINIEEIVDGPEFLEEEGEEDNMSENPIEELKEQVSQMSSIIGNDENRTKEDLINEINNKASGLLNQNFAQEVNHKIQTLVDLNEQLKSMREMDKVNYENLLKERDSQIEQLRMLFAQKEAEMAKVVSYNNQLLAERAKIEKEMVVLSKESFYKMYETMNNVLKMVESINK